MGFYEFRRQLDYKTRMRGNHLEIVDRWFASSKRCSKCGLVKDNLALGERAFVCEGCGFESDRDLNAAMNLFCTVSSTGTQACGEGGSGSSTRWGETVLVKQEPGRDQIGSRFGERMG